MSATSGYGVKNYSSTNFFTKIDNMQENNHIFCLVPFRNFQTKENQLMRQLMSTEIKGK